MANLGNLTAVLDADIRSFQSSINRAQSQLRQYEQTTNGILAKTHRSWQNFGNGIKNITQSMSTAIFSLKGVLLSIGAGLAIRQTLSDFGDMNQGLIEVQKTANLTSEELAQLENRISGLARQIPVSTQGLLEIAGAAGQLGVKGVDNLTLFTETMAKMQLASDVVGAEGAKDLARLLNTAGEATSEISRLGSVIVALGNNMAASEAEIVHMAGEIGRSTAAFKVSSAEAAALGAALRAMGARAELSGSAIGRAMIEMQKVIDEGGEGFKRLQEITQMTGDELRRTFETNTTKVFTAFIHGLNRATQQGQSAIAILEEFGMSGTEAAKGLTPLIKNVQIMDEAFAIANKEIENTSALNEEAARATTSFKNQLQLTKNIIFDISKNIGQGLAPAIVRINKDFRDWADRNREFIQQDLPRYIENIANAILWVAKDVIPPALQIVEDLWNVLSAIPKGVIEFFVDVQKELSKVEKSAQKTTEAIAKIQPPPQTSWQKFVGFMTEWGENIIRVFTGMGKIVGNIFALIAGDALEAISIIGKELLALGRIIWDVFTFNFKGAKQEFQNLVSDMQKFNTQIAVNWDVATNNIKTNWDTMINAMLYGTKKVAEEQPVPAPTTTSAPPPALDIDKRIAKEKEVQKEVKKTESVSIQAGWRATTAFEGFMQGLSDYVATYSSIADNIRSTTQYLAYDMESSFTDFLSVTSSNFLNFRSLITNILGDIQRELARMLVRMAMAGIGGYFLGGGMNTGAPAHINVTPGGATTAFGMHSGGIVGKDYSFKRTVPSILFASAPRLHDGLRADEFPAILQKGETVIPAGQKEKDIKIINVLDPSIVGQYLQTQEGEELVLNIMQRNRGV